MEHIKFDAKDQAFLEQVLTKRENIMKPRNGDYVRFPTGEIERVSHNWGDAFQTSPVWAGSFYLGGHGDASFSGGLNPSIPFDSLTLGDEIMSGEFWFFHHNSPGAGRGVYFKIPCRVYNTTAEYQGFLTRL